MSLFLFGCVLFLVALPLLDYASTGYSTAKDLASVLGCLLALSGIGLSLQALFQ